MDYMYVFKGNVKEISKLLYIKCTLIKAYINHCGYHQAGDFLKIAL